MSASRQLRITPLSAEFFRRPVQLVAPQLLGKMLSGPTGQGQIVEVEAYGGKDDAASHAYRGPTKRSEVMFRAGGFLYVYFIYGMYWCANVVTGEPGDGAAVLIRALAPSGDLTPMFANRPQARSSEQLTNGPGKLCQALGIDGCHNGLCLLDAGQAVQLGETDELVPPAAGTIQSAGRIGIRRAARRRWRFYVADNPYVSR